MLKVAIIGLGYWAPNPMWNFDALKDRDVAIKEKEKFFASLQPGVY